MHNAHEIAFLGNMVVLSGNAKRSSKLAKSNTSWMNKLEAAINAAKLVRGFNNEKQVVLM